MFGQLLGYLFGKMVETPDPSQLTVDYSDAESVLFAASILDLHGEWDEANELYRYTLRHWPNEHGKYARNSMSEIEKKASLSV